MIRIVFELEPIWCGIYMLLRISIKPQRCYTNVKTDHHRRSDRVLDRIRDDFVGWFPAGTRLHRFGYNALREKEG
jgi:hypothetical protein